jgi:hypothetical protein
LLKVETLPRGMIWEPCAGHGAMVRVLRAHVHAVIASDVEDYGFPVHFVRDCLGETRVGGPRGPTMIGHRNRNMTPKRAAQLRSQARRLNRLNDRVFAVIAAMAAGPTLHLEYRTASRCWLSTGPGVPPEIAQHVIGSEHVTAVSDALFEGLRAQTYRYSNLD